MFGAAPTLEIDLHMRTDYIPLYKMLAISKRTKSGLNRSYSTRIIELDFVSSDLWVSKPINNKLYNNISKIQC